jgi:hypothetical protein
LIRTHWQAASLVRSNKIEKRQEDRDGIGHQESRETGKKKLIKEATKGNDDISGKMRKKKRCCGVTLSGD